MSIFPKQDNSSHSPRPDVNMSNDEQFEALIRDEYTASGGVAKYKEWRQAFAKMTFAQKMDALAAMPDGVLTGFVVAMIVEGDL